MSYHRAMIEEIITHRCRCCDSVKNGHNAHGQQQYWCKDCNKRAVLHLRPRWSEEKKKKKYSVHIMHAAA